MNNAAAKLNSAKAFLGVGWSFPPCVTADGATATVAYEEDVAQAIRIIISTDQGERVMRPDFGAGLNSFVFDPITQTTMQRIQTRVQEALVQWEPRIDVNYVKVTSDRTEPNKLL
ncbi:MAG TPA: GPW/gp25 family protein, partial [Pyrinomonadaceae bacterium]|nr:GPW/gp25 family protein [Pyrinomonadaceae bacterium]